MDKFKFFFDTADTDYIREKWKSYSKDVDPSRMLGVTTNPNAFAKENLNTLDEWRDRVVDLCKLVSEIRGNESPGAVHVQMPFDGMTLDEVEAWSKEISSWGYGTKTLVSMKIPPYSKYLQISNTLKTNFLEINVTGISDALTALSCGLGRVRYVSIIPGRMEEVGLDAKQHVWAVMNALRTGFHRCEVITGSMRTLEGLKWCAEAGTIPTIGKRVLDQINDKNQSEVFATEVDHSVYEANSFQRGLAQTEVSKKLADDFFVQMNSLGNPVYQEFKERLSK